MNKWSSNDVEKMISLRKEGWTFRQIGGALGRSAQSVSHKWTNMNDHDLSRQGEPWSAGDDKVILEMVRQGHTQLEIAEHLGRKKTSVMDRWNSIRHGINTGKGTK